jgi:predicted nucleotidyltransferase
MISILQIPFNKIRQEDGYIEVFESLERGFNKFNIDYYLVGATARDVWMKGVHKILPKRATSDIDFGIMIKDIDQFEDLKTYFIETEGFAPYKENSFVLIWKGKTEVDLIPFGELENQGIITVKGTGFTSMNVEGFKEVFEEATEQIQTDNNSTFKVCTLAGIVILKLIAWDDRPEIRGDDFVDIADILTNYFHFNSDAIYSKHSDLFTNEADLDEIAAQYIGREIGEILIKNTTVKARVTGILQKGLTGNSYYKPDEILARRMGKTIEGSRSLISRIILGIQEK